ncbi:uncharacterized protein KZ484_021750 [Pholidichthys leucotaenia]
MKVSVTLFAPGGVCRLLIGWKLSPEARQQRAAAGRRIIVSSGVSSGEAGEKWSSDAAEAKQGRAVRSEEDHVVSDRRSELPSAPAAHPEDCSRNITSEQSGGRTTTAAAKTHMETRKRKKVNSMRSTSKKRKPTQHHGHHVMLRHSGQIQDWRTTPVLKNPPSPGCCLLLPQAHILSHIVL